MSRGAANYTLDGARPVTRGAYRFRPRLLPSLVYAVLLPALLWLGLWQLDRARQKQELLDDYAARSTLPALDLNLAPLDMESLRYRRVVAGGRFVSERQLMLDNQIKQGRPGFNVLTPLLLADGDRAVLVDRGWHPLGQGRDDLPDLALADDRRRVAGTAYVPFDGYRLGPAAVGDAWPRYVQYIDFDQLGELLGLELMPLVLRLDPAEPDGYLREWSVVPFSPERHTAYAVQWFGLATALTVIYLLVNLRRGDSGRDPEGN